MSDVNNRIVVVTECSCHVWIEDAVVRAMKGPMRCKRCGERPRARDDNPEAFPKAICKHEGSCR